MGHTGPTYNHLCGLDSSIQRRGPFKLGSLRVSPLIMSLGVTVGGLDGLI